MKNKFFIGLLIISLSLQVQAQLQIFSSGNAKFTKNVSIGTSTSNSINLNTYKYVKSTYSDTYGLKSRLKADSIMPIANVIAVNGHADLSTFRLNNYSDYMRRAVGVLGEVTTNANCVSYVFGVGVAGIVNYRGTNGGIGIYGSTNPAYLFPTGPSGLYAGFFAGNVRVAGTVSANAYTTISDRRMKNDINNINTSTYTSLYDLRPVSYYFKPDSSRFAYFEDDFEMQNVHYGLIAQELKQIYPNLVYEDESGYLSINYIELIPLLIGSIQELKSEVDDLRSQIYSVDSPARRLSAPQNTSSIEAKLYQNTPNPFNHATGIRYDLPLETSQAIIYIYNMSGLQIASYPITEMGSGSIIIEAGNLQAGMYMYSLFADGQIIDTKQMILTK